MKKGAAMHCARAVHLQIFCTCFCFAAPTGQMVVTANARRAGHLYATTAVSCGYRSCGVQAARARTESLFERGPPVLGDFELSTPNLVH